MRDALALINQTLDEVLAEQEGDFDADSRWALAWFEQHGFDEGDYGIAETLSKAKNTSVDGMVSAGILVSRAGKVRLLKPEELPGTWDPAADSRLTAWEMVHHLVRVLEADGEAAAAELASRLGSGADDRPRTLLPPVHCLRPKEARDGGALLQRPGPELAGDFQAGASHNGRATTTVRRIGLGHAYREAHRLPGKFSEAQRPVRRRD